MPETESRYVAVFAFVLCATMVAASPVTAQADEALACGGLAVSTLGTPGDDVIEGTPGPDVIHGRGGNDTISGFGGDDVICGGAGKDIVRGGPGDDVIFGNGSSDVLRGGAGHDVIYGGRGSDSIWGGAGGDLIFGNSGADVLGGGRGADVCNGGAGNDDRGSCNEPATKSASRLAAGESLLAGQSIVSPDGGYRVTMKLDGNVVLSRGDPRGSLVLWGSDTTGFSGARLATLVGGNLVISHRGQVVWESGTDGAGAFAKINNNANLVVFSSTNESLWDRRANPGVPDWQLPWPLGEAWKAGAPHGTNNGSLDFGPVGGVGEVAAVASGTVGWFECSDGGKYLQVEHGDGWMSTYYHLGQVRTELIGSWVEAGTIVGTAAQAVPCGGRSTFPHVHLVIWRHGERQTADGLSMGGFTVHAGSRPYWGYWTEDATGETVVVNEDGASCCLVNNPPG